MNLSRVTIFAAAVGSAVLIAPAAMASVQYNVVPPAYTDAPGGTNFTGPHTHGERTNQYLIHESLLTELVGRTLTGISFRLPPTANNPWPAQEVSYNFYDIYLSNGVAPEDRSLIFGDNIVGDQTQVRSGGLTVPLGSFPSGGTPNGFGSEIGFDSGWKYTGGHLLLEIRHSGNGVTSSANDAINTNHEDYGRLFSAVWSGDANATEGLQGRFTIIQFSSVPAPGTLALLGIAGVMGPRRRRG